MTDPLDAQILPMLRGMIRVRAQAAAAFTAATAAGETGTAAEISDVLAATGDGTPYFNAMRTWLAQAVDEYGQEFVDQTIVTDELGIAADGVLTEIRAGS